MAVAERKLSRMMLMNIGAKLIYEAANGLAALDAANPDLPLLDWDLPILGGPSGHEHRSLARRIREAHHPLIMLSASPTASRARAKRLGVNEFLT